MGWKNQRKEVQENILRVEYVSTHCIFGLFRQSHAQKFYLVSITQHDHLIYRLVMKIFQVKTDQKRISNQILLQFSLSHNRSHLKYQQFASLIHSL